MAQKPTQHERQAADSLLREFGVKPSAEAREKLLRELEKEKERFVAVQRIRGRNSDRDISR
jgi:hypothetical protein